MGAFFTNPWTIGIGAAILGTFAIWKAFHHNPKVIMTPDPLAGDKDLIGTRDGHRRWCLSQVAH